MNTIIVIILCALLLLAYVFDLTSPKTRIPSVILLLFLGWIVRQAVSWLEFEVPNFFSVLPILGTIGLILIVLEGSLELELNRSKMKLVVRAFLVAFIPLVALAFILGYLFSYFGNYGLKESLINAIPFCVISSAIAIPSTKNIHPNHKEFIIYESSLSDIIGVLIFNFLSFNAVIDFHAFGTFSLQLTVIIVISFLATLLLAYLLNKIEHHVKFIPIILMVVLIYEVSKIFHLPGLVFILLFGLFIGNLDELKRFKWVEKFEPDELNKEVHKFKELTIEATFLIRALFFLVFGFLIETSEVLNADTFIWALIIVCLIFVLRAIQLRISGLTFMPLLFVAPRGLITILLFLSISVQQSIGLVNKSLVIQVVVLTAFIMMIGLMMNGRKKEGKQN
ncbi:MAG: sodium:proton antiporter [Bacteroidota bacterium]|nr:sodium:proton antiporter [Bacteroidota bacterium]